MCAGSRALIYFCFRPYLSFIFTTDIISAQHKARESRAEIFEMSSFDLRSIFDSVEHTRTTENDSGYKLQCDVLGICAVKLIIINVIT